jgi:hypothetical protein
VVAKVLRRWHPRSPDSPTVTRQNGHAERLIGSIRRECLDHIVISAEPSAPDPAAYTGYYNESNASVT